MFRSLRSTIFPTKTTTGAQCSNIPLAKSCIKPARHEAMSILKVCRLGHPVLRLQAQRLSKEGLASLAIQTLIDNMMQTMVEYSGVGLAAPQVHESLSIAVIKA